MVDFEAAHEAGAKWSPNAIGTRGYCSPQQQLSLVPTISDDLYGFGAILYYMLTGAEPSMAPNRPLFDRPAKLLNESCDSRLADIAAQCLHKTPEQRFPSMDSVVSLLSGITVSKLESTCVIRPSDADHPPNSARFLLMARRVGDTLCWVAEEDPKGIGLYWLSTHEYRSGLPYRNINMGSAGVVLALAELVDEFKDSRHVDTLEKGARSLTIASRFEGEVSNGLYVGSAGIGAALLRAGLVLKNQSLIDCSLEISRAIAHQDDATVSPDLFNGLAGSIRFHIALATYTGDRDELKSAMGIGDRLLSSAIAHDGNELCWRIPAGYGGLSGQSLYGYAHGAAGIADVLLDLYEASDCDRYLRAARAAANWIARGALQTLDDESGLDWPWASKNVASGGTWCHGAAGVGRFWLHAARTSLFPEAMDYALRCARMVAHGSRSLGPVQCHGLSGGIEYLLDVYQASHDKCHLRSALTLAHILETFAVEREDHLFWPSEQPTTFTPDFMVGYAGVATCLRRLAYPNERVHPLTVQGLGGVRAKRDESGPSADFSQTVSDSTR